MRMIRKETWPVVSAYMNFMQEFAELKMREVIR